MNDVSSENGELQWFGFGVDGLVVGGSLESSGEILRFNVRR